MKYAVPRLFAVAPGQRSLNKNELCVLPAIVKISVTIVFPFSSRIVTVMLCEKPSEFTIAGPLNSVRRRIEIW